MAVKSAKVLIRQPDSQERGLKVTTFFFLFAPVVITSLGMRGLDAVLQDKPTAMISWLVYSLACAIDVSLLWVWARRRRLSAEIFVFHRLQSADYLAAFGGLALVVFLYQPIAWLIGLFGFSMQGMRFDLHDPIILCSVIIWSVVTAPICEEILFRGLAVQALQSGGFARGTTWLISTAAFAAIHLPYFGVSGMIYIFVWGGVVTSIRLWRNSLTPGLVLHVANNIFAFLLIPLLRAS
jgi:membrane protease YdiL (CAAX protease family)